jgi:hypothetical protein
MICGFKLRRGLIVNGWPTMPGMSTPKVFISEAEKCKGIDGKLSIAQA